MSKRLEMLQTLTQHSKDPFAWYALALEYSKLQRREDALTTFASLRELDRTYLPMYLMAGRLLLELQRTAEAREWLQAGIELAHQRADSKALSEIQAALSDASAP